MIVLIYWKSDLKLKNIETTGSMKVIIESPYAGDIDENVRYARMCMNDSLHRGEYPLASHILYTQEGILNDDIPGERALGIKAGLIWGAEAELTVVYTDRGISDGMKEGIENALAAGRGIIYRNLEHYEK